MPNFAAIERAFATSGSAIATSAQRSSRLNPGRCACSAHAPLPSTPIRSISLIFVASMDIDDRRAQCASTRVDDASTIIVCARNGLAERGSA